MQNKNAENFSPTPSYFSLLKKYRLENQAAAPVPPISAQAPQQALHAHMPERQFIQQKQEADPLLIPPYFSLPMRSHVTEQDQPAAPVPPVSVQAPQKSRHPRIPKRMLGFSLVGGSVMLGGLLFLFILVQFLHVEKHIAYLLQAVASIETNFLLNRFTNWKDRNGNFFAQWIKFHSTSAITFPLNQGLFALLTWLGVPYLLITLTGAGVAAVVNYFANDRFVFHNKNTPALQVLQQSRFNYASVTLPHVGVIVPLRNAQRTIHQCLSSLLNQEYAGKISIFLVGNIPAQDTTWGVLDDFRHNPHIYFIQVQRPAFWTGRDANMKRYVGCEVALTENVDVLAFTDSQAIAPANWLSSAVSLLLTHKVDGVAGKSCRPQGDSSMQSIYQDTSLFSEWPRYGMGFLLSQQNFQKAKGLPVTNNLLITRQAWEQVRETFPIKTTYSWEDFRLAWELACAGCVLYCTDSVVVYRNHRSRFRLAKHIAAGAGAFTFYQEQPGCIYVKHRLWKASLVTMSALLFTALFCIALFAGNSALLLLLGGGCVLLLLALSIYSAIKAHNMCGLLFPLLDLLHIGLWISGAVAVAWREEETDTELANLLVQLR